MRRNLPSVETLRERLTPDSPRELRKVLEADYSTLLAWMEAGKYPATYRWFKSCYHWPGLIHLKLEIADELLGTCGVKHQSAGKTAKSPAFEYCNTGDGYGTTLLHIEGRGFRVGCWADLVARGNYD